jgi:hypothetical protein
LSVDAAPIEAAAAGDAIPITTGNRHVRKVEIPSTEDLHDAELARCARRTPDAQLVRARTDNDNFCCDGGQHACEINEVRNGGVGKRVSPKGDRVASGT